jgi:TetR/AcrR family transcriptional regulator, transcriptional repressor for nem operon
MARTRSFDEAEILRAAMHTFRRDGYAGVSIKRLEETTGLTSGSLYNAYGDKDGLFRAALAYYVDVFVAGRLQAHAGPQATLDDLEEYFLALLREPLNDGFGCLVTNAAVEFGSTSSIAAEGIRTALKLMASGIRGVLEREIGSDRAERATSHLMLLSQGILVLVRGGQASVADIEGVVRAQFDDLRKARRDFLAHRDRGGDEVSRSDGR